MYEEILNSISLKTNTIFFVRSRICLITEGNSNYDLTSYEKDIIKRVNEKFKDTNYSEFIRYKFSNDIVL